MSIDRDELPICEKCNRYYEHSCRWCYFLGSPNDEWIKIKDKKNFDMPSLLNFLVYVPSMQNFIFHVMFCDTDRRYCQELHLATKSMAYGDESLLLKHCTHWRKLPNDPFGKQIIYEHCDKDGCSEHYK